MSSEISKKILLIFSVLLASRLSYLPLVVLWNHLQQKSETIFTLINQWDAFWYLSIIKYGYMIEPTGHIKGDAANWNFFPLYPLLIRCFTFLTGISIDVAGVIASTLFLGVAMYFVIRYLEITRDMPASTTAVILLAFGPYSFYFSSLYSEALYIMLVAVCFYSLEKEQWATCGLTGALLSATRPTGILIFFPALIKMALVYKNKNLPLQSFLPELLKEREKLICLLIIPAGLFAYMTFLYFHVGDPLAFQRMQQVAWHRANVNPFITLYYGLTSGSIQLAYYTLWAIAGLLVSFYLLKMKRYAEGAFSFLSIIIPLSSLLDGIPRYFIGSLILVLGLNDIIISAFPKHKWIILALLSLLNLILLLFWFSGHPVTR